MVNQVQKGWKGEGRQGRKTKAYDHKEKQNWASIECDIEALENCIAAIERENAGQWLWLW